MSRTSGGTIIGVDSIQPAVIARIVEPHPRVFGPPAITEDEASLRIFDPDERWKRIGKALGVETKRKRSGRHGRVNVALVIRVTVIPLAEAHGAEVEQGPDAPNQSPASIFPSPLASYQTPILYDATFGGTSAIRNVPFAFTGMPNGKVRSAIAGAAFTAPEFVYANAMNCGTPGV